MHVEHLASIVSDAVVGVSAVAVAIAAWLGLRKWREELAGKTKFEVARKVMSPGRKLQQDFESARNPFTGPWESAGRVRSQDEPWDVSLVLNEWYARQHRLRPVIEDLQKLQEAIWEAQTILSEDSGKQLSDAFKTYQTKWAELSSAIDSYFEVRRDEAVSGHKYHDQDWLKELKKEIYSRVDDDFAKQTEGATDQLASALKPYIAVG